MIILCIEASTEVCSVALIGDSGLISEYSRCIKVTHSERLLPAIQSILVDTNVTIKEIHAVAVSVGPGSFTSIRVAVSTAKGLAYDGNKPVIPVSSLLGLAHRFREVGLPICTLLDARKQEVYAAVFKSIDGEISAVSPEQVISPTRLCESIKEPTLFVGEGAVKYKAILKEHLPSFAFFVPGSLNLPSAAAIGEIAVQKLKVSQTVGHGALVPNYIRRSEAEILYRNRA
ncbi:MAG: tRNA (adenosine(37)-N6)-threonylcarbamoyltransferase complex dimerization subunit type 1 TsaB [bacterium]